jgi:predicted ATPase
MRIDCVHIKHYKSLSNVTVSMHPNVTVLVGPNGSGKSNFVDALKCMRDIGQDSIKNFSIDERGGISQINEKGNKQDDVTCIVQLAPKEKEGKKEQGSFALGVIQTGSISFSPELLEWTKGWKFPRFSPEQLSRITPTLSARPLAEDLRNWATIFHENKTPFGRVVEAMRVVLPGLIKIDVPAPVTGFLIPQFTLLNATGNEEVFSAAQLSEGTLHIFGLLLTLYQSPAPELIVIEEPEHFVHPGMLALLAECIQEVSEVTQIILTTHSPYLVGLFKPEQIRAVQSIKGKTHIAPIKNSQLAAINKSLMGLEELMSADGLYPELNDE